MVELFIQSIVMLIHDVLPHKLRCLESFLAKLAAVFAALLNFFGLVVAVFFFH